MHDLTQQVLRTDAAGMPLEWLHYQDAVRLYHLGQVAYACGSLLYLIHGGVNAKSGLRSVIEVNSIIATCERLISQANEDIAALFKKLPGDLDEWAAAERARFQERLDGLQNRVNETRDNLNRDLTEQASQAVDEVRQEIHARREAAKGLIGRIADAIGEFLDDPIKAIINEKFGEGIMSAIDFDMQITRVENPKGDRVKIEMSGKYLAYNNW